MHTVHNIIHTVHNIIHTVHNIIHTVHNIIHTVHINSFLPSPYTSVSLLFAGNNYYLYSKLPHFHSQYNIIIVIIL